MVLENGSPTKDPNGCPSQISPAQFRNQPAWLPKQSFCNKWVYFCQRSTFHGLADVYSAPNKGLRIFWLTTFLGALAASVYGCFQILEQYLEAPVVASYFIQEAEPRFPLPDLIVCPFNRLNADFLNKSDIPIDVAQYMQLTFGATAKHPAQKRELTTTVLNGTLMAELELATNATLERLNMTFGQFLDAASLHCTDLFIDCVKPTGKFACCENATEVMTFAGKCYRIAGVDQLGPGYGYGMSVVVSLPKTLYSLALNNWLNDGVVLKLAERDQGVDYDLTFVPVGTHALMPLKATKYEFMNDPPRFECLEQASPNYSRVDCFDACFMEAAQDACQCVIVTNMKKNSLPPCTTLQTFSCLLPTLVNQFSKDKDTEGYFFMCRQRCTPRCTYHQYTSLVSYSKFPSEDAKRFTANETEWIRMKNTIIIDIYYEKLEFTLIKHYRAMTIHGFIANLGGQYSLWLGGSILTLVQLCVFVVNYLFRKCFDGKSKEPSPNQASVVVNSVCDRRRRSNENGYNGHCGQYGQFGNLGGNDYGRSYPRRSISPCEQRRRTDDCSRLYASETFHSFMPAPSKASSVSNGGMYICGGAIEDLARGNGNKSIFKRSLTSSATLPCDNGVGKYTYRQESAF